MGRTKFRTLRGYVGGRRRKIVKRLVVEEARRVVESSTTSQCLDIPMSASAKKLTVFGMSIEKKGKEEPVLCEDSQDDCYVITQKSAVSELISLLLCPECNNAGLSFNVCTENRNGFSSKGSISCKNCDSLIQEGYLCERVGGSKSSNKPFDVNIRAILAFRGIGCGYSALREWASTMNMPYALSRNTYTKTYQKLAEASSKTFEEMSKQTREAIGKAYGEIGVNPDEQGILNIGVSFDGSWQKRGYTSHNGMGSVIDLLTGLPVDYEVLSNFCFKCKAAEAKITDASWKQKHSENCPKNFDGSAGAMEVACAEHLWSRSVDHHKLRYTTMLCDGDSKAFDAVNDLAPYGPNYKKIKEDCINHVSKRMGTALRNLVAESKAQKDSISGKGKLTLEKISKIQNYYGRAIKDNAGDVPLLKKRIMAILLHLSSSDKTPKHAHCPPGSTSWCFWQRSIAKKEIPGKHKDHETLPPEVGKRLVPIFLRLSDENLLKRCIRNQTQNPNESMHNLIWRLCPKTTFVGRRTLETAVCLAICQFAMGGTFKIILCRALNLIPGENLESSISKKDDSRIKKAEVAAKEETKRRRRNLKYKKQIKDKNRKADEGEQYAAGGFNC